MEPHCTYMYLPIHIYTYRCMYMYVYTHVHNSIHTCIHPSHLVDVRDQLALWRVPGLLLAGPQPHLDVEELHLQVAPLCVPADTPRSSVRVQYMYRCMYVYTHWYVYCTCADVHSLVHVQYMCRCMYVCIYSLVRVVYILI